MNDVCSLVHRANIPQDVGYSGNWYNGIVHDGEGNSGNSGVGSMDERNREHRNWYEDDPETADLVDFFFYLS